MEKYIPKSALVAEIERRIKERDFQMKSGCWISSTYMYEDLLDFINTLEVKEMDLEKEFFDWYHEEKNRDYNASVLYERYGIISKKLAKHFFELGLKAKGE